MDIINSPQAIIEWLKGLPEDSHVCIDDGGLSLIVAGSDAYFELGGEPLPPFTLADLIGKISEDAINAQQYFRELMLETDGSFWRASQIQQHGYVRYCKLELRDRGEFDLAWQSFADSQVKAHEWFTFDLGDSYYPAEALKVALFELYEQGRDPETELKNKIEWFLPL